MLFPSGILDTALAMRQSWFGGSGRPKGEVDWARHVRDDTERADQVLWILVGLNVLVFVGWQVAYGSLGDTVFPGLMSAHFLASAESVLNLRLWTVVTANFSHIDLWHLVFNMIGLGVFGREVARAVGSGALLNLYLVGGVIAMLGHAAFNLVAGVPSPALGASGSVMALAVVYGAMFPDRTLLINFFIPIPARIAVGLFIAFDLVGLFSNGSVVAHAAHLGGAAYGLAYWWLRIRRPPPRKFKKGTYGSRL